MSNNSTRNVYLEYKLSSNPVIWHKQDANLEMLATTTYTWCFTTIKLVFYVSIVLSNKYLVITSKYNLFFCGGNGVKLTIGKRFDFFFVLPSLFFLFCFSTHTHTLILYSEFCRQYLIALPITQCLVLIVLEMVHHHSISGPQNG